MCKQPDILESEKIHFAVMAIEAGAREMGISPMEMRRRLEKMNLIKRLLLDNYEVMHTQSLKQRFLSNLTTLTSRTVGCPRTTITGKYYCMD